MRVIYLFMTSLAQIPVLTRHTKILLV